MRAAKRFVEVSFLIPLCEDKCLGNGKPHSPLRWMIFEREIRLQFKGITRAPGVYEGYDEDGVYDQSRKYIVAVERKDLDKLRVFLEEALDRFRQEAIYLNVGGEVEFITRGKRQNESL